MAKTKRAAPRRLIQLYSALLYNAHLRGFLEGKIYTGQAKLACVPGLNCYSCPGAVGSCPLGALQNALAASGHRAPWYMLGILLLFGLTLGRTVCGWLCPMGLMQELLHRIPTRKLRKSRATRLLSYTKYLILAFFALAIPLYHGLREGVAIPGFCKYICPAGTLEGALALLAHPQNAPLRDLLGLIFARKLIILLLLTALCIFCYRAFCRFLCPLGAIYGLLNRLALVGVCVDEGKCTGCGACVRSCKMDVRRLGDHECIQCGDCMAVCGAKAISVKAGRITLLDSKKRAPRSRRGLYAAALGVLACVLLWFNVLDPALETPEALPGNEPGQQLADFTIPCLDGTEFHLADTRGKVTVLNLWATWCGPCVKELPVFDAFSRAHEGDVAVLAVHSSLVTDDVAAFVEERGWTLRFAVDTPEELVWQTVGGSTVLPQTIVLDREGVVVYNAPGSVTAELLEELCAKAS